jgi:hypothetical protein
MPSPAGLTTWRGKEKGRGPVHSNASKQPLTPPSGSAPPLGQVSPLYPMLPTHLREAATDDTTPFIRPHIPRKSL